MSGGILFRGQVVPVPGLVAWTPKTAPWAKLSARDYRQRETSWIRQLIVHTTKGLWPHKIKPGRGPTGRAQTVAHYWQQDPAQSAAQIVIGSDGEIACLCDVALIESFHATKSNPWSIGIEIYQEADGSVFEAALKSATVLIPLLCNLCEFPLQIPSRKYNKTIIERMKFGGPDCVGVFGHRDQAWKFPEWIKDPATRAEYPDGYADRGRGDPGDEIFTRLLEQCGADAWDYDKREDLDRCMLVQQYLNETYKAGLSEDGKLGPATFRAMRQRGFTKMSQVPV